MTLVPTRLLHRADTYLLDFDAQVLAVNPTSKGVELALDRTAFYADSGGQPSDHGRLAGRELLELREAEGVVWHLLGSHGDAHRAEGAPRAADEERAGAAEIVVGATVGGSIDRARRLDHMQQHSGQHILSAACVAVGAGDTISFHLGRDESTIDLAGPEPDRGRVSAALERANACILENREFRVHEIDRADLAKYPVRKDPGLLHDVLRLIEIDGFDFSLCGGTHARRAGEVGPIHVLGWEKNKSAWRVRFLVGRRALAYLESAHELLDSTARTHSIHWRAIPETMLAWREENLELEKELRRLRLERGEREGQRLFERSTPDALGVRMLVHWFGEVGMEEARAAINRFVGLGESLALAGGIDAERGYWFVARSERLPESLSSWKAGRALRTWLEPFGGKGGGNDRFAQGGAPAPNDAAVAAALDAADLARLGLA